MKHTIIMPYPISANRYWVSFYAKHMGRVVTGPTKEAKAYKADVAWAVKAAGLIEPIAGRVRVHLQLYPALPQDHQRRKRLNPLNWDDDVRCIDLDNARKVVYDALKGVLFEDDRWVWQDSAERMEPDADGARVVVTVEKIVPAIVQPTLDLSAAVAAASLTAMEERSL